MPHLFHLHYRGYRLALALQVAALAIAIPVIATPASSAEPAPVSAASHSVLALSAEQMQRLGIATASPRTAASVAVARLPGMVAVPPGQVSVVPVPLAGVIENITVVPQQAVRRGQALATLRSPALFLLLLAACPAPRSGRLRGVSCLLAHELLLSLAGS